jgi:hypothetical protein
LLKACLLEKKGHHHHHHRLVEGMRSGKERTGQTQFSTKFAAKLSFMPP